MPNNEILLHCASTTLDLLAKEIKKHKKQLVISTDTSIINFTLLLHNNNSLLSSCNVFQNNCQNANAITFYSEL